MLYLRVTKKNEHCPRLATACRQLVEAAVVTLLIKRKLTNKSKGKNEVYKFIYKTTVMYNYWKRKMQA